jgi:SAM-dependent methyltransferase
MTTPTFSDHFAPVSNAYAEFRPRYPAALFDLLAQISPAHDLAWDCACGSGQATRDLAGHFARVVATDASAAQLAGVSPHPGVEYRLAAAEASGLVDGSVDLIAVAQALHWFDLPRFYAEARRVLKPGGVLAVWSYGVQTLEGEAVYACVQRFYRDTVGPFWPPERRLVEQGYRTLDFPFDEFVPPQALPAFDMVEAWSLPRLLGYFRSWSATGRYIQAHGVDPVPALAAELAPLWGDPDHPRQVTWPLTIRVGRR